MCTLSAISTSYECLATSSLTRNNDRDQICQQKAVVSGAGGKYGGIMALLLREHDSRCRYACADRDLAAAGVLRAHPAAHQPPRQRDVCRCGRLRGYARFVLLTFLSPFTLQSIYLKMWQHVHPAVVACLYNWSQGNTPPRRRRRSISDSVDDLLDTLVSCHRGPDAR